jgi:predicted XRE-type DNA-binding protein
MVQHHERCSFAGLMQTWPSQTGFPAQQKATPTPILSKARSHVMLAIQKIVGGWKTTQTDAAKRLGLTQPRLNDLLRGRIDRFSLDALVDIATRAGLSVSVKATRRAA